MNILVVLTDSKQDDFSNTEKEDFRQIPQSKGTEFPFNNVLKEIERKKEDIKRMNLEILMHNDGESQASDASPQCEVWIVIPLSDNGNMSDYSLNQLPNDPHPERIKDKEIHALVGFLIRKLFNEHPLLEEKTIRKRGISDGKESLTATENKIMELLTVGHKTREVASEMFISYETARKHIQNIFHKLEVGTRIAAINKWREKNNSLYMEKYYR